MRKIFITISLALATPAHAEALRFDSFLVGAEKCKPADAFARFKDDVWKKYGQYSNAFVPLVEPQITVRIPPEIAAGFGRVRQIKKEGYTEVRVPVTATWGDLPLAAIEFNFGIENGISLYSIRFAARREAVVGAFGGRVAAAAKALERESIGTAGMSIEISKDKPAIVCDSSN